MDEARQSLGGGPDIPDRDVEFGLGAGIDLGHAAEYRTAFERVRTRRPSEIGGRWYLRVCASTDIVRGVLDYLPVSADVDRERYAAVGRALADPKRLCVLESLAIGELSVSDLSTRVGCQVPNMSQHLAVLRRAGLVTSRRDGNTILYRLADPRVLEAYRLIQDIAR
jgi:DNA-binding transcriptional ArsR family regulator